MLSVFTKKNSKNNETTTTVNRVKEPPIIGIDLGTTNSCVAVFENGESKVIKDDEGHATVPSMISISGNDVVRGHSAKNQGLINANNTLFATKRFIGRKYNEVAEKAKSLPYKVVPGPNGDAWIEIDGKKVSPCQVAAEILKEMKGISERYLGKEVKDAVITVPAYFNESQRQATKDAGKIAGLNVMRLINEPTSAALAYGINSLKNDNKQLRVAVFDLGGGTFDISILEINGSVIEVKATNGDSSLGGEDFDRRLQSYIEDEIKKELKVDIEKDATLLLRIREACETAKKQLSKVTNVEICIPFIKTKNDKMVDFKKEITRKFFSNLVADITEKTVEPCIRCLQDSNLEKSDIDEIILVGGMTRCPAVLEIVEKIFGKKPITTVNPDEAVALGAAIQGSILGGSNKEVLLLDVAPLSLGIETVGGVFTRLINRNTTIPTEKSSIFSTAVDNQEQVLIKIYQGEREMSSKNKYLGQLVLQDIPKAPKGVPQILVKFRIDADGLLHVTTLDKTTNKKQEIVIEANSGLTKEEIDSMIKQAEEMKQEDLDEIEIMDLRSKLEQSIERAENFIENVRDKLSKLDIERLKDCIKSGKAVNANSKPSDYRVMIKLLDEVVSKIISRL